MLERRKDDCEDGPGRDAVRRHEFLCMFVFGD